MKRNDYLNPEEYRDGYYTIPGYETYVINKKGEIRRKFDWSIVTSNHSKSYDTVTLRNPHVDYYSSNSSRQLKVHRLVALTFLYPDDPDTRNLQVNHIDRNRRNNSLENLEWVTPGENMDHLIRTNKEEHNSAFVPVQVRNYSTKEIFTFPSIIACSEFVKIFKDAVADRLSKGPLYIDPNGYQYRKKDFDKPWPEPASDDTTNYTKFGNTEAVLLKEFKKNGLVTEFSSSVELAKYLNIAPSTLSVWLSHNNQPVLPGLIQVARKRNFPGWRKVKNVWIEYGMFQKGKRVVQAINDLTGEKEIYETAKELADAHGLLPSTLDWRLKSNGYKVYSNGYRYGYYPFN